MAFCASDISRNGKMGRSFKIYDTPYWTEAFSSTHPSNQPPESASNAHHVLMNMINPCAGSLWTPFKHPPTTKHLIAVADHQMSLTSINSTLALLYKQKQNNNPSLELHKQTAKQILFNIERSNRDRKCTSLFSAAQSELFRSPDSISFPYLHFFLCHIQKC